MRPKDITSQIVIYAAMVLFSFSSIALELIYFHLLLIVTNYLNANFIIAIALFGIAAGGFVSFYLKKVDLKHLVFVCALLFTASMVLAYTNIVQIAVYRYPFFLFLPFFFGSVVISAIFSRALTNNVYFANLAAAAAGVAYPIFAVAAFKSENALILLGYAPVLLLAVLVAGYKHIIMRVAAGVAAVALGFFVTRTLSENMSYPTEVPRADLERVIEEDIPKPFEQEFLRQAYDLDEEADVYRLDAGEFDADRAKYLLMSAGYLDYIDINQDVIVGESVRRLGKHFMWLDTDYVSFSKDSLAGRIELLFQSQPYYVGMSINGRLVDQIDSSQGSYYDPRFPYIPDSNTFIVGLSADGIVKSVKRHDPVKVSGVEIDPVILEIMEHNHPIGVLAGRPYEDVGVYTGEGRNYLELSEEQFDVISLMNIHPEYPSISTVAPEYFHTVEATVTLLESLTDRGMVAYEEIVEDRRSYLFFFKFLNTIRAAYAELGVEDVRDHLIIYDWDFWGSANAFNTILIKREPFTDEEIALFDSHFRDLQTRSGLAGTPRMLVHPRRNSGHLIERFVNGEEIGFEEMSIPPSMSAVEFARDYIGRSFRDEDVAVLNASYDQYRRWDGQWWYGLRQLDEEQEAQLISTFERIGVPYETDLSPITDDKPYPFSVYENKREVTDLLWIVIAFASLLFVPIIGRIIREFRQRSLLVSVHFVYFAVIGFSYMLTEIMMIQHFERFIGSPTYSVLVVLGGFLLFNGIGSFISRYFNRVTLYACIGAIPVVLIVMLLLVDRLYVFFGDVGFVGRMVISALLLMPVAVLMGMPFPNAVERIKQGTSAEYGTLMFGINGAFSTVGATASLLISVTHGFTISFMVGVIGYVIALGLFVVIDRVKVKPA